MSETILGSSRLDSLLEALLRLDSLRDSDVRDQCMEELEASLRRPLDATRFADARRDLNAIVRACAFFSGGLPALAQIVRTHSPGEDLSAVSALAEDSGDALLSTQDREALAAHLAAIPLPLVADAVNNLVDADDLRSLRAWLDLSEAIRMLEALPLPDDGVPQLLTFIDRLAHMVGGTKGADLRRWTDLVAGGLGVSQSDLSALRTVSERGAGRPPVAPTQREERPVPPTVAARPSRDDFPPIRGGVPLRNRNFTGRAVLLDRLSDALRIGSKASVLPQTLHGLGGVGKTQLVIEYVYRHLDEYNIVWWIAAEQTSTVLSSLAQLAERLDLPVLEDRQQTARTVLDALATGDRSWLLIYDNADDPADLDQLLPSTGGHVIITTRNLDWSTVGEAIEVNVFERAESVELLQRRTQGDDGTPRISSVEAGELADKLGDLPLALEQAAAWYLATAMPIKEYIALLDNHIRDLLSEGKPASYPLTVAAFVTVAVQTLRESALATAQLFELLSYLGGEPVSLSLLRFGKDADISSPLRETLGSSIAMSRIVRDLSRYGLAKIDAERRVQVHRLVQLVLRDSLPEELAERTRRNAQNLLTAANPGDPDDQDNVEALQREIGPHLEPSDMIHAQNVEGRQVVLDHVRTLFVTGDYENSRRLARLAWEAWRVDTSSPRLGPHGEMTQIMRGHLANAMRTLGQATQAAEHTAEAYRELSENPAIGPTHEVTLILANQIGADLRIQGRYKEALEFDTNLVAQHRSVFPEGSHYTLRAQSNLAVDHRMVGRFPDAVRLDEEVRQHWLDISRDDGRALAATINVARSYYGMGAYEAGLEIVVDTRPKLERLFGASHSQVILAERTHATLLRKVGQLEEAVEMMQINQSRVTARFGLAHEFSVAATVSLANALRQVNDLDEAERQIGDALTRYEADFGPRNPLTLVALVNQGIILRAVGDMDRAAEVDERCYTELADVLGADHPYTICAGASLATDYSRLGRHAEAVALSEQMLELTREVAGGRHEARGNSEHPYLLMRAINLSHDLRAIGEEARADVLFDESLSGLRDALSDGHPEVVAAAEGKRTEGDIEAPPT
ncbi:FxSxx-COOH system tetratricopeptide repeat protein [Hamadaea tsunoensis]|uniref:FxSxx-COOH system tetratricopeptide repeat protein n=1 Tax=Hamadaea tsunoensis TaxID=53368 RepID=UPI000428C03A|nr:FxSxx-COOH system tetratricopeptide repeat protein [Hamadaea tsunoensis]